VGAPLSINIREGKTNRTRDEENREVGQERKSPTSGGGF
jgi:hypothetical protein